MKRNMKNALDYNVRCGKHVNMTQKLEDLEDQYRRNLETSIESFDSYDAVQAETYNDEIVCKAILDTLCEFGYLESEECSNLHELVAKIRLEVLDEKIGKDGEK